MNKAEALAILREHSPELKEAGILHLRLFGSVARDQATLQSDIDLLVDFDESTHMSLVSYSSLQARLSEMLGTPAELCSAKHLKEPARHRIENEAILAF